MIKILNFGSLNIDHVYKVPHFLKPGETLSSKHYQCFPGGKGLNQSIAIAKAGAFVYHAGKVGPNSETLTNILLESGVNTFYLNNTGTVTGHAIIQVNPSGENCILLFGGSNLEITEEDIDRVFSSLQEEYILVLQNEISNMKYILDKAMKNGMRVALNPSPIDENLKSTDLTGVTWLILNETEGMELSGSTQPEEMAEKLLSRYPEMKIIVTLGEKGAIYKDGNTEYFQPAFSTIIKDTTAAGDTFTGYFLSEIAAGEDVKNALQIAAMASSIAVSREGAACSIPTREEVLKQFKIQKRL